MKRWTPVQIVWNDAHSGVEGWTSFDHAQHAPRCIVSVGMLIKDSQKGVTIALSHDPAADTIEATGFIPRACIVTMTELRKAP